MSNKTDYVELGLTCAEICEALKRGTDGRELDDLSQSVREAIARLEMWAHPVHGPDNSLMMHDALDRRTVDNIREKIGNKRGRNRLSRVFHAKSDKDAVGAWKLDLSRILHVFNVRSITNVWSPLNDRF